MGSAKRSARAQSLLDVDSPGEALATPDIVVEYREATTRYPLVLDVKYKQMGSPTRTGTLAVSMPDRDDLNQIVAYGAAYRATNLVLVQPRASGGATPRGLHPLGTIGHLRIFSYSFDIAAADLAAEEATFAADMLPLVQTPGRPS